MSKTQYGLHPDNAQILCVEFICHDDNVLDMIKLDSEYLAADIAARGRQNKKRGSSGTRTHGVNRSVPHRVRKCAELTTTFNELGGILTDNEPPRKRLKGPAKQQKIVVYDEARTNAIVLRA